MGVPTYNRLINTTLHLYLQKKYVSAYDYITAHAPLVDGNEAQVFNFRYAIASRAGMTGIAMGLLNQAVMEKGLWYSYDYLMNDDDLSVLRKDEGFCRLAEICRMREAEAKDQATPDLKVVSPAEQNGLPLPLLVALHGNEENIKITEGYWNTPVFSSFLKAFPQSSDIGFSDAFFWNHPAKGSEELKLHLGNITDTYVVDTGLVILAGFSAGARTVLYHTLHESSPVSGLILVCPWLPDLEAWVSRLDILRERGVHVYLIAGYQDRDCFGDAETLNRLLSERGVPCEFKTMMQLGHDYPKNFEAMQKEALEYIFS